MEFEEDSKCNSAAPFMRATVSAAASVGSAIVATSQEDSTTTGVFLVSAVSSFVYAVTNINDGIVACKKANRAKKRSFTEHVDETTSKNLEV